MVLKAYKFSMEKVLEWRTNVEKTTMEEFSILQNELLQEKQVLTSLKDQHHKSKEQDLKTFNVNELMQQHLYIQNIEEKIEEQSQLIFKKKDLVEEAREELVIAQKDRKIIEKLKEKDTNEYEQNIRAMEQKELDEMAVLRFNRLAY